MLGGGDLLKAAYSHWLQGDLPGADKLFLQYAGFPHPAERPSGSVASGCLGVFHRPNGGGHRTSVECHRTGGEHRAGAAGAWKDPSKLPHDPAALKQAYERTPPAADGIPRVFYAAALAQAGQKDEARKLIALWPLPGLENDPLMQSFVFPKYLELKRELK